MLDKLTDRNLFVCHLIVCAVYIQYCDGIFTVAPVIVREVEMGVFISVSVYSMLG